MKIVVLNGSPKGQVSVTMQYIKYMQKHFPQHEYQTLDIAHKIKQIENSEQDFAKIIEAIETADAIIWAFPVYYMLVCAQYKRFIELIRDRNVTAAFTDKYAAVLTTSIHFYDHTAHNYMQAICDDLGMRYFEAFSAEMYDLTKESERQKLRYFAQNFFAAAETKASTSKAYRPLINTSPAYQPAEPAAGLSVANKKIVILTDWQEGQANLGNMISRFQRSFQESDLIEIFNLRDVDIKGGCLGCIQCAYDNTCIYQDGFKDFVLTKLKTADILVFAGSITDRYLSAAWKQFFDRTFFNGHVPLFAGKQFGFIITGPLSQIPNLRQIIEAYTDLSGNLAGIVTDEFAEIDQALQALAQKLITYACQGYSKPKTFLQVGGRKIFRDEIWGHLRFPFIADYKYYSQNNYFNFPYKNPSWILSSMMALLTKIPAFRKEVYSNRMKQEMIKSFEKVLEKE